MTHPIAKIPNFRYDVLKSELDVPKSEQEIFNRILRAYNDDFWQESMGSLLPPAQGPYAATFNGLMEKRFVFRNVIRECVERVSKAFLGKNPNWKFSRAGKEITDGLPDIEKGLGSFWNKENVSSVLAQAFESRLATGKGGIRMYVPVKFKRQASVANSLATSATAQIEDIGSGGLADEYKDFVKFSSIEEALAAIRIEFIDPRHSTVLKEDAELFSIVQYQIRENWENNNKTNVIEFSFVDNKNLTFIGMVPENSTKSPNSTKAGSYTIENFIKSSGYDLNGETTFYQMQGKPYVTSALFKNNQLLNLALTCAGFSLVDNGFGEVFLTNVELETETVRGEDGELREEPKRLRRGGGAVQNLIGISQINEETGQETRLSPGVHFKEPTSISAFIQGKDLAYQACLEEAGQMYALISGDATASGESRIQAMKDFYLKIIKYKSEVDQIGSWLLTTALRWAGELSASDKVKDMTVVFDSKIFIGDVTKEERQMLRDQWKDGVISKETCQVLSGVDDPQLETELILAENSDNIEEVSIGEALRKTELAVALTGLLPERMIRKIAFGYDDKELDQIEKDLEEQAAKQLEDFRKQQGTLNPEDDENIDDIEEDPEDSLPEDTQV